MSRKKFPVAVCLSFALLCEVSFADSFTDAIQDLAIQTACIGQYSATQAGGGWYDDPHDYYTPPMMAERFKNLSGNMTRTTTFYGVCFDYAQFAWQDITQYKNWYNEQGMYEGQFWLAGVNENSSTIILSNPTTRENATSVQNGVYIRTYPTSNQSVKTHKTLNGTRATHHAWLWIERADGVWFWIDPTWTDNLGYVVYGYVKNGEEIQCRPDPKYCINYPTYLNNLPNPPAMGRKMAPSTTANSTNHEETINYAAPDLIDGLIDLVLFTPIFLFTSIFDTLFDIADYSSMNEYSIYMISANIPFTDIPNRNININEMGFSFTMGWLTHSFAFMTSLEYLRNFEDENHLHGGLFTIDFARRLFNNITFFAGGGVGLRFDTGNTEGLYTPKIRKQLSYIALKGNTGFLLSLSHLFTKIEVSYDTVLGFSAGVGIGWGSKTSF